MTDLAEKAQEYLDHVATIGRVVKRIRNKTPDKRRLVLYDGLDDAYIHNDDQSLRIRTTPIALGVPMDEIVMSRWVGNLFMLNMMPWDTFLTSLSTYIPEARNIIHENFVEHATNTKYLVMLDSDVMPPPNFIETMLNHLKRPDVHVVGGWYQMKRNDKVVPIVYHRVAPELNSMGHKNYEWDEIPKRKGQPYGLEAVDAAGAGCWVMDREAAEAIGPRPYNMNEGGEDLTLCKKLHAKGYKTWVDWSMKCAHVGVGFY